MYRIKADVLASLLADHQQAMADTQATFEFIKAHPQAYFVQTMFSHAPHLKWLLTTQNDLNRLHTSMQQEIIHASWRKYFDQTKAYDRISDNYELVEPYVLYDLEHHRYYPSANGVLPDFNQDNITQFEQSVIEFFA